MKKMVILILILVYPLLAEAQNRPIEQANRYFLSKDYQKAIEKYNEVLSGPMSPDKSFALFQLGECYRLTNNWEMAGRAYQKLTSEFPGSDRADDAYLALGNHALASGKNFYTDSIMIFEAIISQYSGSDSEPAAWLGLGEVRAKLHHFQFAENALDELIKRFPDHSIIPDAIFARGQILASSINPLRNVPLALDNFKMLTNRYTRSPHIMYAYFTQGDLYWEIKKYQQAVDSYQNVVSRFPDSFLAPLAQTNIGLVYSDMEQYPKAVESLEFLLSKFSQPESVQDNVRRLIEKLKSKEKDKLEVSAWVAQVDKKEGKAFYQGDVRISLGQTAITSDQAEVDIRMNQLTAKDNVRLKWGSLVSVTADEMVLDVRNEMVRATGDVVLNRRIKDKVIEERWPMLELSLKDGSSTGRSDITAGQH